MDKNDNEKLINSITKKSIKNDNDTIPKSKNNDLENIKESEEEEEEEEINSNPLKKEEIKNIKQKIFPLESKISNLQKNFNEFIKENIKNKNNLRRNTFLGLKTNFSLENHNDNFEIPKLIKEKFDLQENNEKMENILKEKEKQISELNKNLNKIKNEKKKKRKKNIRKQLKKWKIKEKIWKKFIMKKKI